MTQRPGVFCIRLRQHVERDDAGLRIEGAALDDELLRDQPEFRQVRGEGVACTQAQEMRLGGQGGFQPLAHVRHVIGAQLARLFG